jgi:hypothetical protein
MEITGKRPGVWKAIAGGGKLVFRHQRLLWWLFLINFALALIAVLPVRLVLGDILDHSLASSALADHFDLMAYAEVIRSPKFNFNSFATFSLLISMVFAMIVVLSEAGVIQEFHLGSGIAAASRRQTAAEFFGACGSFAGRTIRLMLWSLLPLGLVAGFRWVWTTVTQPMTDHFVSEVTTAGLAAFSGILFLLLFAAVRLWTIMTEIHIVATGQRSTGRAFFQDSLRVMRGSFGNLCLIQLVIGVSALATVLLGLAIWVRFVPPPSVAPAFLVSELTLLVLLACRLWQRASLVVWYHLNQAALPLTEAKLTVVEIREELTSLAI